MAKHHPGARRVRRSGSDEDVFVAGVLESSAWAKTHGRTLAITGVTVFLVLAGLLYYRSTRTAARERAAAELSQVRATFQTGNLQLARQDLENFVKKFGNTPSGAEAKLMLAQVALDANEPASAVSTLQPLARDLESPLGYNAALLLGAAHEAAKQLDQAERVYLRIGDDARFAFQKREGLDHAARLRVDRGDAKAAAELYERILATFVADDDDTAQPDEAEQQQKMMYEMRLAEVRAQVPPAARS